MSALGSTVADAEVTEVLPGLAHVHLPGGLPLVRVTCQDGWTSFAAAVHPPLQPWALLARQTLLPNLKFALVDKSQERGGACELRAEIPASDGAWASRLLVELRGELESLAHWEPATAPSPVSVPRIDPDKQRPDPEIGDFVELLSDLDHPVESRGDGTFLVSVASGRQQRQVRISREADWWRAELPLGAGDVLAPAEPQQIAVGLFLLRAAAAVRFVRPFSDQQQEGAAGVLGFDAHLPLQPSLAQLEHALGSLVTAVQRFEIDIESLATEAILSHAFVAIAGGASSTANQPTYEL